MIDQLVRLRSGKIGLVICQYHNLCEVAFEDGEVGMYHVDMLDLVPRLHKLNSNGNIHTNN